MITPNGLREKRILEEETTLDVVTEGGADLGFAGWFHKVEEADVYES